MAIRSTFTTGEVLTAADLTDTIKGAFINTETTTARTLGTADAGNLVTLNNNSGGTVTIPTNTTWGSPLGTLVHLINIGTAGSFTVGTAAGVTLNAASATLAIQEGGTLIKTATNTWQFVKGGAGLGKAQYSSTTGSPTVTTVSGKTCVQFTGSGSITISQAGLVEVLVVGAGGGGGAQPAYAANGGGGSGQHLYLSSTCLASGVLTVTVGAGGSGGTVSPAALATNGSHSVLNTLIASGGGGGNNFIGPGQNGASGSGCDGQAASYIGKSVSAQYDGAKGAALTNGGGGGGSSAAGAAGSGTTGGAGGAGTANSITGSSVTRCGGGGGGGGSAGAGGAGGTGGGGTGSGSAAATAGSVNTGGGGGGGNNNGTVGANGGSGIVILLFG